MCLLFLMYLQISDEDVYHKLCNLINRLVQKVGILVFSRLELSKPLAVLFQKSLDTGTVPNDWKLADVAPVFKKSDHKLPSINYRPISLTPESDGISD